MISFTRGERRRTKWLRWGLGDREVERDTGWDNETEAGERRKIQGNQRKWLGNQEKDHTIRPTAVLYGPILALKKMREHYGKVCYLI